MVLVFGKANCEQCKKKIKEMRENKVEFTYHGLDTADGLARAAGLDILSENRDLPIIVEVKIKDSVEEPTDYYEKLTGVPPEDQTFEKQSAIEKYKIGVDVGKGKEES